MIASPWEPLRGRTKFAMESTYLELRLPLSASIHMLSY